jgi:hypothetical protein
MEITITIKINAENSDFEKRELKPGIKRRFTEITGYEIDEIRK